MIKKKPNSKRCFSVIISFLKDSVKKADCFSQHCIRSQKQKYLLEFKKYS